MKTRGVTKVSCVKSITVLLALLGLTLGPTACQIQAEDVGNTKTNTGDASSAPESPDPTDIPDEVLAISGKVTEVTNGSPIQGAMVTTEPSIGQVTTNGEGNFVFTGDQDTAIQLGVQYRISATRPGYAPNSAFVTVQPGHNRNVDIQLTKSKDEFLVKASPTNLQVGDSDFGGGNTAVRTLTLELSNDAQTATQQNFTVFVPAEYSWISVQPAQGTVGQDPVYLTVTINKSGKTGFNVGTFDVSGSGGKVTINVTMNLGGTGNGGGGGGGDDAGAQPAADAGP